MRTTMQGRRAKQAGCHGGDRPRIWHLCEGDQNISGGYCLHFLILDVLLLLNAIEYVCCVSLITAVASLFHLSL
jgi:hypothetical protein